MTAMRPCFAMHPYAPRARGMSMRPCAPPFIGGAHGRTCIGHDLLAERAPTDRSVR